MNLFISDSILVIDSLICFLVGAQDHIKVYQSSEPLQCKYLHLSSLLIWTTPNHHLVVR